MRLPFYIVAFGEALCTFGVCFALTACRSEPVTSTPTINFAQVPALNTVAPGHASAITGRATGVRSGQQIVIYARNDGRWGLQRQSGQPFMKIENDGRWAGSTQTGSEYAALLVEPGYNLPS